jgi:hypothetical protein
LWAGEFLGRYRFIFGAVHPHAHVFFVFFIGKPHVDQFHIGRGLT